MLAKEEKVLEWIKSSPNKTTKMLLHFLDGIKGAAAIHLIDETAVIDFMDGSRMINYDFMFQIISPLSQENDDTNITVMIDMRKWQEWIYEQDELENYPDFGGKYSFQEVLPLSAPMLAQRYPNGLAKYQFPARLIYLEQK